MLLLSGIFMAVTLVVFALYGVFAAALRRHVLQRPRVVTWMRRSSPWPTSCSRAGWRCRSVSRGSSVISPPARSRYRGGRPGGPDDAGLRFGHAARDPQNLLWVMPAKGAPLIPRLLTVAGSDSGGGAGIQADLKAFAALGCHGMSAICALTAQNTVGVEAVHDVPVDFVRAQIRAVASDIGVDAAKTGMLSSSALVAIVTLELAALGCPIVVDPVMVATSGARLLAPDAEDTLRTLLLPRATVATPNLEEARVLAQMPSARGEQLAPAVLALGPFTVVVTGGDADGVDWYADATGVVADRRRALHRRGQPRLRLHAFRRARRVPRTRADAARGRRGGARLCGRGGAVAGSPASGRAAGPVHAAGRRDPLMRELPTHGAEPVPDDLRMLDGRTAACSGAASASGCWCSSRARSSSRHSASGRRSAPSPLGSAIAGAILGAIAWLGSSANAPGMVLMRGVLGVRGAWPATGAQRRAERRLGDLRDDRDRARGARRGRRRPARALDGARRRRCDRARAGRPAHRRAPRPARDRRAHRAGRRRLPDLVVGLAPRLGRRGEGGMGFWLGVDLAIALAVSWAPMVADYARFARAPRATALGTVAGSGITNAWFMMLGAMLALVGAADFDTGVSRSAGVLALGLLALVELDKPFANVYSTVVSIRSVLPRLNPRMLVLLLGAGVCAAALAIDLRQYEAFLLALGSLFVPLAGALLGSAWRNRGFATAALYRRDAVGDVRVGGVVAWLAGVALYQWIAPSDVWGWPGVVEDTLGTAPSWLSSVGASLPSLALAGALAFALTPLHADARVEHHVDEVDHEVEDDHRGGGHHEHAEQHG